MWKEILGHHSWIIISETDCLYYIKMTLFRNWGKEDELIFLGNITLGSSHRILIVWNGEKNASIREIKEIKQSD